MEWNYLHFIHIHSELNHTFVCTTTYMHACKHARSKFQWSGWAPCLPHSPPVKWAQQWFLNFPRYGFFFVVCIKLSNYVESTGQATQWFGDIIFHISRRMFTTWFTLSEPSLWNILCLVADWARQSVSLGSRFWTQLHCDTQRELPEAPLHLLRLLSLKHKRKWSLWELFRPEPAAYWAA